MESHGKLCLLKNYKINWVFCVENSKNIPKMKKMISKKMVKFRSWKTPLGEVMESHGISKAQKSTNPAFETAV